MRLLVGEIFDFSDLREREPFPEAPVYEKTLFWTDLMHEKVFILIPKKRSAWRGGECTWFLALH
jgi:hypothetical protein